MAPAAMTPVGAAPALEELVEEGLVDDEAEVEALLVVELPVEE